MRFDFAEEIIQEPEQQENNLSLPKLPFFLPRPVPCPVLPDDMTENWLVDRMPVGIRLAFVKCDGDVYAMSDTKCLNNWYFCRMCNEHIKKIPDDNFLIDGVLKPDGMKQVLVEVNKMGRYYAFDYVSLFDPGIPLGARKRELCAKVAGMPETELVPGDEIKDPAWLDEYFYVYQRYGDRGVCIKRKDSVYEVNQKEKPYVDNWQRIP